MPRRIAAPARSGAQERQPARSVARHPDPAQGQHRNRDPHQPPPPVRSPSPIGASPQDAFVAARLRAAGAIILGKTNLSEWANYRSTHSTSGWSGRGGQTKNPYALDRNPSGSSSGSGAAAVGQPVRRRHRHARPMDRSPARHPSTASLASSPPSDSSAAPASSPSRPARTPPDPMARTVRDVAILLSVMAGVDPQDPATRSQSQSSPDYTRFLDPNGLRGARLGIARKFFEKQRAHGRVPERLHRRAEESGRRSDRSRRPCHARPDGRPREAGTALRIQGRHQSLPDAASRPPAPARTLQGPDRIQRKESRSRDALLRPGAVHSIRGQRPADRSRLTSRRAPIASASRARKASTLCSPNTSWTPS